MIDMDTTSSQIQTPIAPSEAEGVVPLIREYIGIKPGYCGGKPHILGHRIKVKHIAVMHERMGMSPAQIVGDLPTINLAEVHAALAYYYSHQDEIEAEIAQEDRAYEELNASQPSILERIQQRMANAQDDPLPPG
jgi:uncharacterized protein (DUF433 family)